MQPPYSIPTYGRVAAATLLLVLLPWFPLQTGQGTSHASDDHGPRADIEVFASKRCPHCTAAKFFLRELQKERPRLTILIRDIDEEPEALLRLERLTHEAGFRTVGVPTFYVRGELIVGFAGPNTTGERIKALLAQPSSRLQEQLPEGACLPGSAIPCDEETVTQPSETEVLETPLFGRLDAREIGLPLFTVVIGLLDGFNPCAMWVLLFLLSLLVNFHSRLKMALIAGTFVVVSGLVYFAFMAAWLNVFLIIGFSRATQLVLGAIALLIGAFNIKDFFFLWGGPLLKIPEGAKPGLYVRMRQILHAENLVGALSGIVLLAILVNMVELLCTAGFPAMYTHILTLRELPWWTYYGYLVLYNVAYMFDDAVMVTIAVVTLGHRKLQEKEGRWLKLISGIVMVGLAAVLIAKPEWLAT